MSELTYGWVGKILRVDLTSGKVSTVPTSNYAPDFIGGRSMGAKIYWDEVPPEVGAYDPENRLIFTTGPADGTLSPTATRTVVTSKSPDPIPNLYFVSNAGCHWGGELKYAGYDGIIVQGRSPKPVYLWIHDGEVEIRAAGSLWGATNGEAHVRLRELHGQKTKVMSIGPAGENLVRPATITSDSHGATGQGGFGAVMGSKNLKAIAVRGTGSVKVARPKELMDVFWHFMRLKNRKPGEAEPRQRTGGNVFSFDHGCFPEEAAKGNIDLRPSSCFGCTSGCLLGVKWNNLEAPDGVMGCNQIYGVMEEEWYYVYKQQGTIGSGPASWTFGKLCDELGLSVTGVIGHQNHKEHAWLHAGMWAMQLVEAGLWTTENTGLPIDKFGTSEFWRDLLTKVARREGIGNLVAEGQQRYLRHVVETAPPELKEKAQKIYNNAVYKEKHTGLWQLIAAHHREGAGHILYDAVSARMDTPNPISFFIHGSGHLGSLSMHTRSPEEAEKYAKAVRAFSLQWIGDETAMSASGTMEGSKARVAQFLRRLSIEADSLTWCRTCYPVYFSKYTPDYSGDITMGAKVFSAVTGIDRTQEEMGRLVGDRTFALERSIWVREGRRREHDTWSDYTFDKVQSPQEVPVEQAVTFKSQGADRETFYRVLDEYYKLVGWDLETGIPKRSMLEELGLGFVADELEKVCGVPVTA